VEKLARIAQHVMPGSKDIGVDADIDHNTADWLNGTYTTGERRASTRERVQSFDEGSERIRLERLDSTHFIVTRFVMLFCAFSHSFFLSLLF
jgi:hypothetical protein